MSKVNVGDIGRGVQAMRTSFGSVFFVLALGFLTPMIASAQMPGFSPRQNAGLFMYQAQTQQQARMQQQNQLQSIQQQFKTERQDNQSAQALNSTKSTNCSVSNPLILATSLECEEERPFSAILISTAACSIEHPPITITHSFGAVTNRRRSTSMA